MSQLRVMHFMNQFFAGIGGEEKADTCVGLIEGQVGAGKRLQELLGKSAEIVVTAYCGDDYFAGNSQQAIDSIRKFAQDYQVSLIVAGPAFSSGRYGFSCAQICHAMAELPGLVCVTAMHPENPGLETYRQYKDANVYAVPTAKSAAGMGEALAKVARFALKIANMSEIGPSAQEDYIPRGVRKDVWMAKDGAERAVDMLLAKLAAKPFVTEIPADVAETVPVAPAIGGLATARIALATSSGVIAKGNPDNFKAHKNVQWKKYSIQNLDTMKNTDWDVLHSGFNNIFMRDNPNFGIPLDVSRSLESEGAFANLYPYFYTTSGCNASVPIMKRLGREMVSDMKAEKIDGVIMVST
jgi:glycine reductase complex component B subunit gamma